METFLQNTAKYLYGKYGGRLSDCALVFPNRRAGLFFTRYLSSLIDKPVWLPGMFTIADLLEEVSTLKSSDPISLNFELYRIFRSVTGSSESFDEFYNWGEVLLGDFDEIDKYLVDAEALFRNVTEIKNLESRFDYLTREQIEIIKSFWSTFQTGAPTLHQKEFLRIWEALAGIYNGYRRHLFERDFAYEGMIFRHAAEKVLEGTATLPGYDRFFIAGFNALNECEKVFFDYLQKEGRVEFIWDYDEFYTLDFTHQAGTFMRENLKRYPHTGFSQETRNIDKTGRTIDIIAVPSNSGQPKILPSLKEMFSGDDPLKTAVILPDEGLLLPVLSSLPEEISEINVTMGYPLKDTPVYGFVMHLLSLHKNARITAGSKRESKSDDDGSKPAFYYKDVLALLQHPDYAESNEAITAGIIRQIRENNLVFIEEQLFSSSEFGRLVFRKAPADILFIDYITDVLMYIVKHLYDDPEVADEGDSAGADKGAVSFPVREFLFRVYTGIGRLKDILAESGTVIGFDTLIKLIKKVLSGIRVPFYGEPLGGVQVMGVLETRTLDFENVIWLSVNEGVFPARQMGSSFVPYSLRKAFGLPGIEQQDAVYSYYFYRMLQRTRRMTLVYNTKTDGLFTGEPSRFIYQLKFGSRINVRERSLVFNLLPSGEKPLYIEKTAGIMKMLKEYAEGGPEGRYLSPAAINAYMDCPLRFYFRYIVKLPEPEAVTEEVDMLVFGNLLHTAAQLMYTPCTGKELTAEDVDRMSADSEGLDIIVKEAFGKVMKDKEVSGGLNLIIAGVLKTYLRQLLAVDRKLVPFRMGALEEQYSGMIRVETEGESFNVRLGGYIDRIDEAGGTVRVVDYKTGSDDAEFRTVESLFERGDPKRRKAVFQTMMYAWLYQQHSKSVSPVSPVLYQVRKFFGNESLVVAHRPGGSTVKPVWDFSEYKDEFEAGLQSVLSELFDPRIGFSQAGDTNICRYCHYSKLCHRD